MYRIAAIKGLIKKIPIINIIFIFIRIIIYIYIQDHLSFHIYIISTQRLCRYPAPAYRARIGKGDPRGDTRCMEHVAAWKLPTGKCLLKIFHADHANALGGSNCWQVRHHQFTDRSRVVTLLLLLI